MAKKGAKIIKVKFTDNSKPRCGLCGKTGNLIKTPCCGQWICDDADSYVLFSYARNSCYRNHDQQTLCAYHYHNKHTGDWQTCPDCRQAFMPEIYVYSGTNEYNFTKLENPPSFEPTKCAACGRVIALNTEGYTMKPDGTFVCEDCFEFPKR
jgi:hypothetical protein